LFVKKLTWFACCSQKKDKGALADGDNEDLRLKAQKVTSSPYSSAVAIFKFADKTPNQLDSSGCVEVLGGYLRLTYPALVTNVGKM